MSRLSDMPWFLREYIHDMRWDSFRDVQERTFEAFADSDRHILVSSATSSGKTEAVMFPVIGSLYSDPPESVGALYVGPLKALIDDQFQRIGPMIERSEIKVSGWHGDISASVKNSLLKRPEGILQITPESLQNILTNHLECVPELFGDLRFVIIDEVHSFMSSDRGSQLLCSLEAVERICGCRPRRLGLSAAIRDTEAAGEWLSARTGIRTEVISGTSGRDARVSVRHYVLPPSGPEGSEDRKRAITRYYRDMFKDTENRNCIIFTNSRISAERTAMSLSKVAERYGKKDIVSVHHGSISGEFRKMAENSLKDPSRKTVTVATSSLELGIDVGTVERIIQIDPPTSCSSMLQRMGRSGRRDGIQDITILCSDDGDRPWTVMDGVSLQLVRCIAVTELSLRGWTEMPDTGHLPYGLLFHQTMEYLKPGVGCRFSELRQNVLTMYPFREISPEDYRELIDHLIATGMLEKMSDGTLLIGQKGERIVFSRDFCSVFQVKAEYGVYMRGKHIGSIQDLPERGSHIQLAGRLWEVTDASKETQRIEVIPSQEGSCAPWRSDAPYTDDRIMEEMRRILMSDDSYAYLDANAAARLEESRRAFREGCMYETITEEIWGIRIYPWCGTKRFETLRRVALSLNIGTVSAYAPYRIDLRTRRKDAAELMERAMGSYEPEGLVSPDERLDFGRYDAYIPRHLLLKSFVSDRLSERL